VGRGDLEDQRSLPEAPVIEADAFLNPARARGFGFYAGVPCSFLSPIINRVISDPALEYVGATSEGEAVAIGRLARGWRARRPSSCARTRVSGTR
jgi:hypothetical protein